MDESVDWKGRIYIVNSHCPAFDVVADSDLRGKGMLNMLLPDLPAKTILFALLSVDKLTREEENSLQFIYVHL